MNSRHRVGGPRHQPLYHARPQQNLAVATAVDLSLERTASWPLDDAATPNKPISKCAAKNKGPRFFIGGLKNSLLYDCPRYMNVPRPCCVAAAGVGKQSVWGLRIIAELSITTLTFFSDPVNSKKWKGCRELNSDLKVRSLAPSIRWTTSPSLEGAAGLEPAFRA